MSNIRLAATRLSMAALLAASAVCAQAQTAGTPSNGSTTTRAATKADLKNLEQNGYTPKASDPQYPNDVQAAEKKAQGGASAPAASK